jgi:hypothetical protein
LNNHNKQGDYHEKNLCYLLFCGLIFSVNALAAPGEYWELTSAMEGMGMSMPARTSKECMPLKDDGEPAGVDKNCKISDLKHISNDSTWKMSCNDGTTGSGKQTRIKDTITSDILMNTSDGSMKISMKGKHLGGSCQTDEKLKAVTAEVCDLSNRKTYPTEKDAAQAAIVYETFHKKGALCAGNKDMACSLVKRELPNDLGIYYNFSNMQSVEQQNGVTKGCGLGSADSVRRTVCQGNANNRKEIHMLDTLCPAEAKVLHQKIREEECSGRQFTAASDKAKCMAGVAVKTEDSANSSSSTTEHDTSKQGNTTTDAKPGSATTGAVQEGTKALKGLKDAFGF